jgi:hypothetical protein
MSANVAKANSLLPESAIKHVYEDIESMRESGYFLVDGTLQRGTVSKPGGVFGLVIASFEKNKEIIRKDYYFRNGVCVEEETCKK